MRLKLETGSKTHEELADFILTDENLMRLFCKHRYTLWLFEMSCAYMSAIYKPFLRKKEN